MLYGNLNSTSFGYTKFTFEGSSFDFSSGEKYFKLEARDAAGQPMRDEFGSLIAQKGRVVFSSTDRPPEVQQQAYSINYSPSSTISRLQDFNAFGEVSEERDERVGERMLAAINDDRKAKGLGALTALSTEQQAAARTTLQYNVLGKLVAKIDPETFITAANGYRYRDRPITKYGYDLLGRHTTTTDANGNLSRMSHVAGARGEEGAAQFEFDAVGGTADTFDAVKGGIRQTRRDIFGDVRRVIDAELHVTDQSYDDMGRLITVTRKNVRRFDALGAAQTVGDLTDRYEYDGLGQRIRATNALQFSTATDYDGLGRITRTASAQGGVVTYKYDFYEKSAQRVAAMESTWANPLYSGGYVKTTTLADGRTLKDEVEYFGHLVRHGDMTGFHTTYSYNSAGRLILQMGRNRVDYFYYANGYLSDIADRGTGTGSSFGYDNSGNRVSESHFAVDTSGGRTVSPDFLNQDNSIVYDELNRIIRVYDPKLDGGPARVNVRYEFDAVGNRRLVDSIYLDGAAGFLDRQTYWYAYDELNRFTVTKGQLNTTDNNSTSSARFYDARRGSSLADSSVFVVAGAVGAGVGYDKISQRTSANYTFNGTAIAETYAYSDDGYLQLTKINGQLKTSRELDALGRTTFQHDLQDGPMPGTAVALRHTQSVYDRDNRLLQQLYVDDTDSARNYVLSYLYYDRPTNIYANTDAANATMSEAGFGALGKTILRPGSASNTGQDTVTTYTYRYGDSAQQLKITKTVPGASAGVTDFTYDNGGHLKNSIDRVANVTNTYYTTSDGLVLSRLRVQSNARTSRHNFFYADRNRIGDVGDTPDEIVRVSYAEQLALKDARRKDANAKGRAYGSPINNVQAPYQEPLFGSTADFDQNYEPINDNYPGAAASNYTVRTDGETLASIAQALWGDRAMWYLIGESNGLSANSALKAGQLLVIPNKVTNIHNNSTTWRPYNPGEAIGRTDPTTPVPSPPKKGCGAVGTLIMVVVAVAATLATAGALAPVSGQTIWAAGATALSGGSGLVGVAAAAVGGAAGSIASQAVGIAMGNVDSFSWKAVGQAALRAGVTAGVGSVLQTAGYLQYAKEAHWGANAATAAGRAALGTGATMALKGDWNWRNVMVSAVSAGVGSAVGSAMGGKAWAAADNGLGQRLASGLAGSLAARGISRNRESYETVFASVLGNAIGESLAQPEAESGYFRGLRVKPGMADILRPTSPLLSLDSPMLPTDYSLTTGGAVANEPFGDSDNWDLQGKSRAVGVAGREAARGAWGIASSLAGDRATNAEVNRIKNQLLALNPELAEGVQKGQRYYVPEANTPENRALARSADRKYQAAQASLLAADGMRVGPTVAFAAVGGGYSEIRSTSAVEGFLAFNPVGRFLNGWGRAATDILTSPYTAVKEAVLMTGDAVGNGTFGVLNWLFGGNQRYQNDSALGRSLDTNGLLSTIGLAMKGAVLSLPGIAHVDAINRSDWNALGASGPGMLLAAAGVAHSNRLSFGNVDAANAVNAATIGSPIKLSELRSLRDMGLSQSGRRAVVEGFDLGLGLTRVDDNFSSLADFAKNQQVRIYFARKADDLNLFNNAYPGSEAKLQSNLEFLMDRAKSIKFNLDGLTQEPTNLSRVIDLGSKGIGYQYEVNGRLFGNTTNWEASQILSKPALRDKTTFFFDGQKVD